jgi:AhpD family alkylhydroperoxidase
MKEFKIPQREDLDSKSQIILDRIKQDMGSVPNIYSAMAYSSDALENYIDYSNKAGKSSFSSKEIEAIKLSVAQTNGCTYCLAAHTMMAKIAGLTEEETLMIRKGEIKNERLAILTMLAAEITRNRGHVSNHSLGEFYKKGFTEKDLVNLLAVIVDIIFTNYLHILTNIPVDFPLAKDI